MSTPARVQVIIVSYRTAEYVKRSLGALCSERVRFAVTGIDIDCFVIDNSGEDVDAIRAEVVARDWTDWVEVVAADRNGGFAYGNNRGFAYGLARDEPPDFFYLLNPDAEIRPGAIVELVDFMQAHPTAGAAASGIEDEAGELWAYAFRFPSIVDEFARGVRLGIVARVLSPFVVSQRMGNEPAEVDWFPGAAMMCRADVVRQLGGMDEAFFLYFEETDFCRKLARNGWSSWYVPKSRVVHATGQSTGVTAAGNETKRLPEYWFESRRRYFVKNHGPLYAMIVDATAVQANVLGWVVQRLRGRGARSRDRFLRDLISNATFLSRGYRIQPPVEDVGPMPTSKA